MEPHLILLIVSFLVLLWMNMPVAIAIGLATWLAMLSLSELPVNYLIAQRMCSGIKSFPLLAIPFFILAGILMGDGGMARRLINFAQVLVGHYRGGLAYVSTLTCMLFGSISGSATAAVSSVGGMLIPEMRAKGFDKNYSIAVTTTAATTGLLIPPSNVMIVYAVVAGDISVASMFMAGIFPGILVGIMLMVVVFLTQRFAMNTTQAQKIAVPAEYGALQEESGAKPLPLIPSLLGAVPSLLLVVIVLAGILGGVFSATEAAAIAVSYAFVMAVIVYREVKLSQLPDICLRTGLMTAVVFLLISTSQAMSWFLAYEQIPQSVAKLMLGISENPVVLLLLINVLLLFVGTFMDMTPAVLIFAPILLPIVTKLGMDPVHFGIMLIANLCIGLCTPPVGTCLFVGCSVGQSTIAEVSRPILPFFIAMFIALLMITFVPALSMALPHAFGK